MRNLISFFLLFTCLAAAQETSATLSSKIEINGLPAKNIELILIHKPTNYRYYSVTDKKGYFVFSDLEVGGPYELIIVVKDETFNRKYEYLKLGENDVLKINLK
jgi:hypothetical protein